MRACALFFPTFYSHVVFMYSVVALYGHGLTSPTADERRALLRKNRHTYKHVAPKDASPPSSPNKRESFGVFGRRRSISDLGDGDRRSYLHLFQPHMLIALVCLIYTNLIQLYALCRFLILVNFLNQLFPIVPGTERVRLPASCYGRCGHLFGVYLFIAAWVVTLAVLNLTRLRSFFLGRRDLAAERAEKQKQFDETSRKLDVERDAG
jgi:hypothetical protein